MLRSQWSGRGFGDGDPEIAAAVAPGAFDPSALTLEPAASLSDLLNAQAAAAGQLVNVDPLTAVQSKLAAVVPKGAGLPLAVAGLGVLALLLIPSPPSGGRRR